MLARRGEITDPCPVPRSLVVTTPSSRTPALSHLRIRRMMRGSATGCSARGTASPDPPHRRKRRQTTHRCDIPDSVTITRERHPFERRSLAVISSIRRGGVLFLLVSLPDGSRSLIPAEWTNWNEGHAGGARSLPGDDTAPRSLGRLADLLRLRHLVDALRGRPIESTPQKESRRAIESGLSRPTRSAGGPASAKPCADTPYFTNG